jgi:probable phosphoglycerate mutase
MIYLCRHGETEFNRERRVQGQSESVLTGLGRSQAAAMARLLQTLTASDPGPWRLIASPLGRTRATAEAIGERLGLSVQFDDRLMEVSLGAWEGRLWSDLARLDPTLLDDPERVFRGPGGETYADLMARVTAWLAEQEAEPHRRLIVVSHGVAGRLLRGAYAGLARDAILAQDVPQDAIFRLSGGAIARIECTA